MESGVGHEQAAEARTGVPYGVTGVGGHGGGRHGGPTTRLVEGVRRGGATVVTSSGLCSHEDHSCSLPEDE